MNDIAAAIESARNAAGLSQRALADRAGISQSTLHRILSTDRVAKLPELIVIADAVGCTVSQLTGSDLASKVQCVARASGGASMEAMRQRLLHFMELESYLDEQAIAP